MLIKVKAFFLFFCLFFLMAEAAPKRKTTPKLTVKETQAFASKMDALVFRKSKPVAIADEVFARRTYLRLIGRIPTYDELILFLSSNSSSKRQELIDKLIESSGYVSHQFNFWADLLRIKTKIRDSFGEPYMEWIKESLTKNTPYDKLVSEMIVSEGSLFENGATGFYARDKGMPKDNMANTVRVFLGTRLECAQCHNHPFDKWKQRDFYQMLAYTEGLSTYRPIDKTSRKELRALKKSTEDKDLRQALRYLKQLYQTGAFGSGSGMTRLPDAYEYKDAKPKQLVRARAIFGAKAEAPLPKNWKSFKSSKYKNIKKLKEVSSRKYLAHWLTSKKNPRFSKVIANRLWKQIFGRALIEPVDELTDRSKTSHPEAMKMISSWMVEFNFDMKQFVRTLCYTQVYQQPVSSGEEPSGTLAPVLERMSAEQIWDSMMTLIVQSIDQKKGKSDLEQHLKYYHFIEGKNTKEIFSLAQYIVNEKVSKKQGRKEEKNKSKERKRLREKFRQEAAPLRKSKRWKDVKRLKQKYIKKGLKELSPSYQAPSFNQKFVRASELRSPEYAGHPLRQFGQSNRDVIEGADRNPRMTQSLTMMNGWVVQTLLNNSKGELAHQIKSTKSSDKKIEVIYLSLLGRRPDGEEKEYLRGLLQNKTSDYQNLVAALLNCSEYIFIR